MYVAVKGGERAINNAHKLLAEQRRGDKTIAEIETDQIEQQLSLSVTRVMAEGSLYDRDLAALAIKQARGDLIEAIFLMRAYRTTLPRFAFSKPIKTAEMDVSRRISATFKDLPGGQILGPTFDYTHRLLDFTLMANGEAPTEAPSGENPVDENMPRVLDDILNYEGLIQDEPVPVDENAPVADLTREPVKFPAGRDLRLQNLSRGDEGFVLALGYSTQRGYANSHAFVGEIRYGTVSIEIEPEELGFAIDIGDIELTECETVN
ncbi:carbon-phosphorus lyase complex subunit PhnI, partial [Thalassospira sp. UBA4513]